MPRPCMTLALMLGLALMLLVTLLLPSPAHAWHNVRRNLYRVEPLPNVQSSYFIADARGKYHPAAEEEAPGSGVGEAAHPPGLHQQ